MLGWGNRGELRDALGAARLRVSNLQAELAGRNRIDGATGLLTAEAFHGDAHAMLSHAAVSEQPLALVLVAVERSRSLDAQFGAGAGEDALAAVAAALRVHTRVSDVAGRLGSDELAVLMADTTLAGARACCQRIDAELRSAPLPHVGAVEINAGVAAHRPQVTLAGLLDTAGRAMRHAGSPRADAGHGHESIIEALAGALMARDRYTGEHSAEVVTLSRAVATQLGLGTDELKCIGRAALVHDIGKVGVPDGILHKRGPLDEAEWALMRTHPAIGERILRAVPGLAGVATIVRHEHERFDGLGYPDGLDGERIPIGSRVILVCDAYHAITSDRPYRAARDHEAATAELRRCAGTQFDPNVVAALIEVLSRRR